MFQREASTLKGPVLGRKEKAGDRLANRECEITDSWFFVFMILKAVIKHCRLYYDNSKRQQVLAQKDIAFAED